jgi:hypothetical protein
MSPGMKATMQLREMRPLFDPSRHPAGTFTFYGVLERARTAWG